MSFLWMDIQIQINIFTAFSRRINLLHMFLTLVAAAQIILPNSAESLTFP